MKNSRIRVILLLTYCFIPYLVFSLCTKVFGYHWTAFDKINLLTDVFPEKKNVSPQTFAQQPSTIVKKAPEQDFNLYQKPEYITDFYKGDHSVLPKFMEKLNRLKNGDTVKIRIAYFGDSMIEGDLLTQTLRKLLQQEYSGSGVGYVPISSEVAKFRQTTSTIASGWADTNFKTKNAKNLYLSGHYFTGSGSGIYTDNTVKYDSVKKPIQKSILFGAGKGSLVYNGKKIVLNSSNKVNRKILSTDASSKISIQAAADTPVLYGLSFESDHGVFVDNFSFRGISGIELNKLDTDFLHAVEKANHYDLIVFQYGVNLLFKPNDTDYSFYTKQIDPVLSKFKKTFNNSEFLMIGSADRAFRYDGQYKTAIGLPNLLQLQAQLALKHGFAFYNQFQSMGGENSIVRWAEENPALANKDYIHPNAKGTEILAKKIFSSIQKDYHNYLKKINVSNNGFDS